MEEDIEERMREKTSDELQKAFGSSERVEAKRRESGDEEKREWRWREEWVEAKRRESGGEEKNREAKLIEDVKHIWAYK